MARDLTTCEPSWEWEEAAAFRWQRPQRPEDPGVVRDVGVDPFSLNHFSRVDIDRPLPIPSVSVDDRRRVVSPSSSTAAGLKKPPAAPAWWEWDGAFARPTAHSAPSSAALAEAGFDVVALSSSTERKAAASEPQRWGSDVPLIAAADGDAEEECSFGGGKDGKQGKHAGNKAPFTCCMFVPGLTRRTKPPTSSSTAMSAAARSYSSGNKFGNTTTAGSTVQLRPMDDDPGTSCSARRASTMAVSLERFDCGLDDGDGEAASASSYLDLPLELILGCGDGAEDDADVPVCAAFLFDSDGVRRSVLKRSLQAVAAGWEPRRPSLGKVSVDASGWVSNPQVRVSLESRSP